MKLMDLINSFSQKRPAVQNERIEALLFPKSIFNPEIEHGRVAFFDRFASTLEQAIVNAYGNSFEIKKEQLNPFNLKYTFSRNDLSISYDILLVSDFYQPLQGPLYNGILSIEQEKVDLERVGRLLTNVLNSSALLAYNGMNERLLIAHGKGKHDFAEGEDLLKQIGISVHEYIICEGGSVGGMRCWIPITIKYIR